MKILALSDIELGQIYSPQIITRYGNVDLVIGCGDLPYYYLEYVVSMLKAPLYYVRGNHAYPVEEGEFGSRTSPWGAIDLHQTGVKDASGLLLAGIQGSLRYNNGPYQYSQNEMWLQVWSLIPKLFLNRLRYGRFLDIFVTHSSPWHIHDADDLPHQGIKAFLWFDKVFRPGLHLHGHIHIYRQGKIMQTLLGKTRIINAYGVRELEMCPGATAEIIK
jgi:uncharacterized protein